MIVRANGTWVSLGGEAMRATLSAPLLSRTTHFSLQHLAEASTDKPLVRDLSTEDAPLGVGIVDNRQTTGRRAIGFAIPKRFARRAVTRNLIRRQMRLAATRRALTRGAWLLRLRAAFDLSRYPSAASPALKAAVQGELDLLFTQAGWP